MVRKTMLIGLIGKIFDLTSNTDEFITKWKIPNTTIVIIISYKRAEGKFPNGITFETKDIKLEYHFNFNDKEKYETFLFTTLGHIIGLYQDELLIKKGIINEKDKSSHQ